MGDMIGGESPSVPSSLQSAFLRVHGRRVAASCVRRCYESWPDLEIRYGRTGRQHASRDAAWHLEHLDEALAVGEPRIFADYADWLAALLRARGIGLEQVAGAFGFLADGFEAVECPASQETDRSALVSILRDNQFRLMLPPVNPSSEEASRNQAVNPQATTLPMDTSEASVHRVYFDTLIKLDRTGAFNLAESYLCNQGDVLDLYVEVLGPAMIHAGKEWQAGRISEADEHYISEVTCDIIRRYGPLSFAKLETGSPVAVACSAPRERHGIGLMMVADALRAGGLQVHMLGVALPAEAVVAFVDRVEADLLCISCTMEAHLNDAAELISLARRARSGLAIAVGGAALCKLGEGMPARLGADCTAADAREIRQALPAWCRSIKSSHGDGSQTNTH